FMTPECLTQLENVFLVDELRTDPDRTTLNYFLTKAKGSQKYEGVVVIDLENMLLFDYCRNGEKDDFKNFILYPYSTATPQQNQDVATYKQRVVDLKELIQSGSLSKDNITVLKNALTYDFPKEIKKACKERKLKGKKRSIIVDPVERLWEYNNNEIGKDLGL
ncbi:MAG: hypothetical protein IKY10_02975, partial [Clostridia bacterium]|nr:hypothetical protein [Clostridia bacterium]